MSGWNFWEDYEERNRETYTATRVRELNDANPEVPIVQIPRPCKCEVCNKDLTAKPTEVNTFGHPTRALRAPPRVSVRYTNGKSLDITIWLCEEHGRPSKAFGELCTVMMDKVIERGGK